MTRGTTISLYLVNGEPSGLICAYLSNWTGQSLKIPRNLLDEAKGRTEINRIGIYFLFGFNIDNPEEKIVYIGEADNIYVRLVQHAKDDDKSFWTEVIAFSSKDDNLTKGHIKYLEHRLIAIAKNNSNFKVYNKNDATKSPLPEMAIADMETYLDNLKLVLPVLGYNLLDLASNKKQKTNDFENYNLDIGGIKATGYQTNNGFVVKKDSRVSEGLSPSLANGYKNLRTSLIEKEVIKDSQGNLIFIKDYEFSSPSAAAAIIVGYPINGRISWKDGKGKTLKENEEAALG